MTDPRTVTRLLLEWRGGEASALDRLIPIVYPELRRIAARAFAREKAPHTLQPTAVLHQAYVRLIGAEVDFKDRSHFFAIAAREMRRVLVDHARRRRAARRGGEASREGVDGDHPELGSTPPDFLDLDAALERLRSQDERAARAVELHYFGGMEWDEIAEVLGTSRSTVARDLRYAKAWLKNALSSIPA